MQPTSPSTAPGPNDIVEKHWRRIYKLCLFYLHDLQDAEDAAQQVFEKILIKHSQFQGQSDPYTWIYRIAVNTALNMLRRRKIVRWLELEKAGEQKTAAAADPALGMESRQEEMEKRKRLQAGIARLSAREKKAFYLFYYEQLQQKDIAAIMRTSVPAVESLVHKAVRKIRAS
ncbi:MAG: sigma-70 family RNA polymerase sigma factor [Candidatus Aminicenantes bacterium]|nr:sigma-70 family RNA polymerase sigma factor [Acidobacteriota bacterium]MBU4404634.1 sigma-70 family RNA polymerase sigma factor [Acidobacteriota bacterium]MCG2810234.1 sigma-70 family RNA polymerase sigma factor [Candidatus Aminicenantes bacterium]